MIETNEEVCLYLLVSWFRNSTFSCNLSCHINSLKKQKRKGRLSSTSSIFVRALFLVFLTVKLIFEVNLFIFECWRKLVPQLLIDFWKLPSHFWSWREFAPCSPIDLSVISWHLSWREFAPCLAHFTNWFVCSKLVHFTNWFVCHFLICKLARVRALFSSFYQLICLSFLGI